MIKLLRRLRKPKSANLAKERLQIIIAHERSERSRPNLNLPELKQELLAVIAKYIKIDEEQIQVKVARENNCSILELNVTLPNK